MMYPNGEPARVVVAVDFGETNSAVAYTFVPQGTPSTAIPESRVKTIRNYRSGMVAGWVFRPLDELRAAPRGPEDDSDGDSQMNNGSHILWGYQVLEETMQVTSHSGNGDTLLYGFKTFMDRVYNDETPRHHVIETLTQLGENNPGRKIEVHEMLLLVTIDFLTKILKHAKNQIMQKGFNITSSEIVICVPVIWSQRALRKMQTCGGTCDALTYTVTRELPVRLRKQPIRHSGDYCGSKALNEGVHRLVYNLLKDHTYLEKHGVTIAGITRKLIDHDFDKMTKPSWSADVENYDWRPEVVGIRFDPGNPNAGKYNNTPLVPNRLTIRACLEARLARINAVHSLSAEIYRPDDDDDWTSVIDAVAKGGVCRALNKENGPIRKLKSSYGVGRYEVYDPDVHRGQKIVPAFHNGKTYVSTIRWVCKMNEIMPAEFEIVEDRIHTFPYWNKDRTVNKGPFFCTDEVYVSDSAHLDHLSVDDEHNEGSEMICILKNEITRFYKPGLGAMNPFEKRSAPRNKKRGRAHWEFRYQLVYVIDGLNMRCFQRYNGETFGELKIGCAPGLPSGSK
ncbi:hypothetical protein HG530_001167 [Fusarium avenaceum]|nr:hypothetical protein HG530_001167 [Fusarium avenaceum]